MDQTGAPDLLEELEEYGIVGRTTATAKASLRRDRPRDRARRLANWRGTASQGRNLRVSGPRPIVRRRCSSGSWAPRCAPAARLAARRLSRASSLAAVCTHLQHLLLVRDLRLIVTRVRSSGLRMPTVSSRRVIRAPVESV